MLRYRLLSAAGVIAIAVTFVWLDANMAPLACRGFWMLPLGLYLYVGSAFECVGLLSDKKYSPVKLPAMLGTIGVAVAASVPVLWPLGGEPYPEDCLLGELGWPLAATFIALVACFVWFLRKYEPNEGVFLNALLAGWICAYFGISYAFAVALRMVGQDATGLYLLVGMIFVTKFADAGAYFSGRALGRIKLCANVSPGKTVEGLIGGAAVASVASFIFFNWMLPWLSGREDWVQSWAGLIVTGAALTLAGVAGDLLQSIFKREFGKKDSGRLLPGLGGIWDVTDSLMPGLTVGYLLLMAEVIALPK